MDAVEILRCEIQSEIYERQIKELIEQILKIDEAMQKSQTHVTNELAEIKAVA